MHFALIFDILAYVILRKKGVKGVKMTGRTIETTSAGISVWWLSLLAN
jgi:hypothetical protein